MRRRGKIDANQHVIVQALRDVGATVLSIANMGDGAPDLLVSFRGCNYLMEVKMPGKGLTPDEIEWHNIWRAHVYIVYSVDDSLKAIGAI
jgi:hypothetical protein